MKKLISLSIILFTTLSLFSQDLDGERENKIQPKRTPLPPAHKKDANIKSRTKREIPIGTKPTSTPPTSTPPTSTPQPKPGSSKDYDEAKEQYENAMQIGSGLLKDRILIYNSADKQMEVYLQGELLSVNNGIISFDTLRIKGQDTKLSEKYSKNPVVKIPTETTKSVTYTLGLSKEYFIFWNAVKQLWDIKENPKPQP